MISFELFEKCMKTLEEYVEKDRKLLELVGEGIGTYSCDLEKVIVELLENEFEDTSLIEWWIYDCDFGQDHATCWDSEDVEYDVSGIKDFYYFLVRRV